MNSIEKNKKKNLKKISRTIESQISEKMKKIYTSNDNKRKAENKKIKELEIKKLGQYTSYHFSLMDLKEKINKQKEKEKEKYINVKENISILNRSFNEKSKDLNKKLNDKFKKISDNNKNRFLYLSQFIHKREKSFEKNIENNFTNKMYFTRLGNDILKFQHNKNLKSIERNKSLNDYKEIMR